ncbi:MAG: HAD-IIB family hydrolase [Candidatus Paceibacterota bacterium]
MIPRIVFFDLDNTLAVSKQVIKPEMAIHLAQLISHTHVAIISGGKFEQLITQAATQICDVPGGTMLSNLHLLPTSGAALYDFMEGSWMLQYEERLSEEEIAVITSALEEGVRETGLVDFSHRLHGDYIENRGSQVSLSCLGQEAPLNEKQAWDPDHAKRQALQKTIAPLLPNFDVKVGGLTTIDVTKHGINKAYGVRKLCDHLSIPILEALYIGDELGAGGNDEVVKETGIPTRSVTGPSETAIAIEELISA